MAKRHWSARCDPKMYAVSTGMDVITTSWFRTVLVGIIQTNNMVSMGSFRWVKCLFLVLQFVYTSICNGQTAASFVYHTYYCQKFLMQRKSTGVPRSVSLQVSNLVDKCLKRHPSGPWSILRYCGFGNGMGTVPGYIKPLSSTSNLDQIGRYRKITSQSVEGFWRPSHAHFRR